MICEYEEIDISELSDILKTDMRVARLINNNGEKSPYIVTSNGYIYKIINYQPKKIPLNNLGHGYLSCHIKISHNGKNHGVYLIHRIIAEAFIPNPENKPQVNHIDGNKHNNDISNLEWATAKENMNHAVATGLLKYAVGEDAGRAIISEQQAREICRLLEQNELTLAEIAKKVGTTKVIVYNIKHKIAWVQVSDFYNVENHTKREDGTVRMTEEIAHGICKELERNYYTIREIAELFGVTYAQVDCINQHKCWTEVSNQYNIDNHIIRATTIKEYVPKVPIICDLLQNTNMSPREIAKKVDVDDSLVYRVLARKAWKHVSKDYDFSARGK